MREGARLPGLPTQGREVPARSGTEPQRTLRAPREARPARSSFLVDDVDAEAERLRGLGVEFLSGPVDWPWGHRTLHLLDPDGFVVELAQNLTAVTTSLASDIAHPFCLR